MEQRKGHQKWSGEAARDLERLWWLCKDEEVRTSMTAMSKTLFRKSTVCQAPCWGLSVLWIGRKKIFKKETEVENFVLLPARQRMQRWGGVGRGEVRLEGSVGNKESSKAVWWGGGAGGEKQEA